jgi:UPF0755 protein
VAGKRARLFGIDGAPEEGTGLADQKDIERVPDAPVAKRRRPAFTRVLASLLGWGLIFAIAATALLVWGWSIFTAKGPLAQAKTITLPEGASRAEIAGALEQEGFISDSRVFNGATILWSLRGKSLQSGEYEFQPGASMANVIDNISAGRVVTYKITVPEGWTSQMALARINSNEILVGDAVPLAQVPEGSIVANTEVFHRGMTRANLVGNMMTAQARIVDDVWARKSADSPLKSKEQLVVLASIVERETGVPEERPRVAAVFLNRLKQGMRLQSDPTIIYGLVGGQGKLDRALTREDIDKATPYNTYQIDGLPPGPIAIPGRAALEAVVAPAPTDDLYFVADGSGGHAFAKTLEEHNANVAKWRNQQAEPGGTAVAPAGGEEQAQETAQNNVIQPELPAPELGASAGEGAAPVVAGSEDAAIAEAAQTQQTTQPVPVPADSAAAAAAVTPPTASPPRPVQKLPQPAMAQSAEAAAASGNATPAAARFVPGTVVEIDGRKVPVPLIKQKKKL